MSHLETSNICPFPLKTGWWLAATQLVMSNVLLAKLHLQNLNK